MKITIMTKGDPSVGIAGEYIVIDWPGLEVLIGDGKDEELRSAIGENLRQAFTPLVDGKPTIEFDDEFDLPPEIEV